MADDRRIRLREPGVYFSIAKDENFFDPAYARQLFATVDVEKLDQLNNQVPDEAWDAFLAWRDILDKSPRKALAALDGHSHRRDIERSYDIMTIYYSWRTIYDTFPNLMMSFEDWQLDKAPTCTERGPNNTYTSFCLPIPDWRSNEEKAADAKSLEKGERARAAWEAGPCDEIWNDRYIGAMQSRKAEWDTHDCSVKLKAANYRKDPDR